MSTPIPRTSSAIIASGFQAVPEGFRAFAGNLERELTALTDERDQLRSDCENETKWAAHYLAQSIAEKARAERAEADLAKERARLDWLLQDDVTRFDVSYHDRAAIDAAMKEHAK